MSTAGQDNTPAIPSGITQTALVAAQFDGLGAVARMASWGGTTASEAAAIAQRGCGFFRGGLPFTFVMRKPPIPKQRW